MSQAPWATTAAAKPYGFRLTIERRHNGAREEHTFFSKVSARHAAVQAAGYKKGFIRLLECVPLNQQEWEAAKRVAITAAPLGI